MHWIFAQDIDASYQEPQTSGANNVGALEMKPWGLRQFTVEDLDGSSCRICTDESKDPYCRQNPRAG